MNEESGFTLTELMIIIAIIAILAALALPSFIGRLPAKRMESAASDINAAFQVARLSAIKENTCVVISFSISNDNYRIFVDNGGANPANACDKTQEAGEPTIKAGKMPAGVVIEKVVDTSNNSVNTITFDSRGLPSPPVKVSLQNETGMTWIEVNIAGGLRIHRG